MEAPRAIVDDDLSNYGSDFNTDEEEIVDQLLRNASNVAPPLLTPGKSKDHDRSQSAYTWHSSGYLRLSAASTGLRQQKQVLSCSGEADDFSNIAKGVQTADNRFAKARLAFAEPMSEFRIPEQTDIQPDIRTPLQRFRSKPRKTLSVTDLVSPSWCELQYWYTLTKHGRKPTTPAMRQGSAVHKVLEDQVHRTVEIDVRTREDAWGLRLWNVIQGLKGLREIGLTRELEIWGVLRGEVINGVIDELSFRCPDEEMERTTVHGIMSRSQPAADQVPLDGFLRQRGNQVFDGETRFRGAQSAERERKIYLADVKTRGINTLPSGASFRLTAMQLMLYHVLLSDLATDRVDAEAVFDRYTLKSDQDFSDPFLASILNVDDFSYASNSRTALSDESMFAPDSSPTILSYKSLRRLWALMIQEFQITFPFGSKSLGQVLRAEYRGQADGTILGEKNFPFDGEAITRYLEDEMKWWKGERAAQGVCIEEAYKCRTCEFADDCEWRKKKVDEATEAHRRRSRSAI